MSTVKSINQSNDEAINQPFRQPQPLSI